MTKPKLKHEIGVEAARRSGYRETLLVAALFVALTFVLAYPVSVHPASTALPGDADTDLFMWTLAWDTHALATNPLGIFNANIFHPNRLTLAYSENLIGSAFFAAPVLWASDNPVLALNVVALLSCVLCGIGGHFLGRVVGLTRPGAIVCGIVFAFSPARFFRIGQLHLTTVQWIPFSLAFLHRYLASGRPRDLQLAVAFFSLQALTSGHGAVFLALALGGLLVYHVARGEPIALGRRLRDFGAMGAVLLTPAALLYVPYRAVQVEIGLRRTLDNWGLPKESFLASPARLHSFLLSLFPNARINENAGAYLFPGFLTLALAVMALVAWPRGEATQKTQRAVVVYYALLALVSVWLTVGPPLGIWQFVYWLPGLNFIRGPSRFMILAVLAFAVLAGFGFERVTAGATPERRTWLTTVVAALLVVEFATMPLPVRDYSVRIPAVDRWLATQPRPFVVAEFPVITSERYHTAYMLHSTTHWQKTVHGYSGIRPSLHEELYRQMRGFPDEASLDHLARLGVTHVVVHTDMYPPGEWEQVDARIHQFSAWLTRAHTDAGGVVYLLRRPN
jgi:hypothetical protein